MRSKLFAAVEQRFAVQRGTRGEITPLEAMLVARELRGAGKVREAEELEDEALPYVRAIAFSDARKVWRQRPDELAPEIRASLASVKLDSRGRIIGFTFRDKNAALDVLWACAEAAKAASQSARK